MVIFGRFALRLKRGPGKCLFLWRENQVSTVSHYVFKVFVKLAFLLQKGAFFSGQKMVIFTASFEAGVAPRPTPQTEKTEKT